MISDGQRSMREYLHAHFVGPRGGAEEILTSNPVYAYLTGMLFPIEEGEGLAPETLDEDLSPGEAPLADDDDIGLASEEDDDQDDIGNLTAASGWTPSSMGLSFINDGPELVVTCHAAQYIRVANEGESNADGSWQRSPLGDQSVIIASGTTGQATIWGGLARLQWRSRPGKLHPVVTVALSNASSVPLGRAKKEVANILFQSGFDVEAVEGAILPYPGNIVVNATMEDRELEYRYRHHASYAIGHGVAATWGADLPVTKISTDALPAESVPRVTPREASGETLVMKWLADPEVAVTALRKGLLSFADEYGRWIASQRAAADTAAGHHRAVAHSIVDRMARAMQRIHEGIELLAEDELSRRAFRMANASMRLQSTRSEAPTTEPSWRPFQLAFILMSLASTADPAHEDRELVDLIWFPTGGGKTEAYLGLAAFEMIRRRLSRGVSGGGTAVITRYTMRLLTAQQFQRAARLICALQLMRSPGGSLEGVPAFSIGLLLGNSTTPGTFKQAEKQLRDVRGQLSPQNPFQVRTCPWCDTPLMPERRSTRDSAYGFRAVATSFSIFCVNPECPFHADLPMQVVDEGIYKHPPSIIVATVDKFARLAWIPNGGSIFGLAGVIFDPPSLVIQDELHLISGPLGTIVGIYEAAIRALLTWKGPAPKVVASTATIRSADEQVLGLMASRVEVFPPSGLDADDSFFAELDAEAPGRLYLGVMPQAFAPAWAIGQAAGRLLAAPQAVSGLTASERDAYWTLVLYHNSLRELGRTVTILRDDVRTLLEREEQEGPGSRTVGSDAVYELTSNVSSHELVEILERLEKPVGDPAVIDALAATNILSVGIDVARLGLMMVNGQPKTTSEYIQATSRVGRDKIPGIVLTLYRSGKARDRSTFEGFRSFHGSFYRFVEPTSVTPWALQARRRALRAVLVILVRHAIGWSLNSGAESFDDASPQVDKAIGMLMKHIRLADPREAPAVEQELRNAAAEWTVRGKSRDAPLKFESSKDPSERLLKSFGDVGVGWPTMHSMRSVERAVRIRARGEKA
jgi:hypothetical protein